MNSRRLEIRMDEGTLLSLKDLKEATGRPISELVRAAVLNMIKISTDENGYIRKDIERIETSDQKRFYPKYNTAFDSRK